LLCPTPRPVWAPGGSCCCPGMECGDPCDRGATPGRQPVLRRPAPRARDGRDGAAAAEGEGRRRRRRRKTAHPPPRKRMATRTPEAAAAARGAAPCGGGGEGCRSVGENLVGEESGQEWPDQLGEMREWRRAVTKCEPGASGGIP